MWRLTVALALVALTNAAEWTYHESDTYGPSKWKDIPNSDCGLSKQSPIDIPTGSVTSDTSLGGFTFTGYDAAPSGMSLRNNGHTAQVDITGNLGFSGGGLPGAEYKTAQFHFHWGGDSARGSEHLIDGKAYPLEMHIVSYNAKYPNLTYAAQQSDGLGVLGLMFVIGEANPAFNHIVDNMQKVTFKGEKTTIPAFKVDDLFGSRSRTRYFRYKGSLTTPMCWESATWTVFAEAQTISENQMSQFRTLSEHDSSHSKTLLVDCYRPVQPLNGRTVKSSFVVGGATSLTSGLAAILASIVFAMLL